MLERLCEELKSVVVDHGLEVVSVPDVKDACVCFKHSKITPAVYYVIEACHRVEHTDVSTHSVSGEFSDFFGVLPAATVVEIDGEVFVFVVATKYFEGFAVSCVWVHKHERLDLELD